jgi:mRNA-degrading endonuclease YafQ of YafQ-DinJ toxin-antitoxin module
MANPAALLFELLRRWDTHGRGTASGTRNDSSDLRTHIRAVGYLEEISQLLDVLEQSGRAVGPYRRRYESWVCAVFAYPKGWESPYPAFDSGSMDVLENLTEFLEQACPKADLALLADLGDLLNQVIEWLPNSQLPADLKSHLYVILSHCRQCVEEYDLFGDFALQAAVDRLLLILNVAVAESKDKEEQGRWKGFRDRFVYPFVVSTITNVLTNPALQFGIRELGGG